LALIFNTSIVNISIVLLYQNEENSVRGNEGTLYQLFNRWSF